MFWSNRIFGISVFVASVFIFFDIASSGTGTGMPGHFRIPLAIAIGGVGLAIAFPRLLGKSEAANRVRSIGWVFFAIFAVLVIAGSLSNFIT